MVHKDEPPFPVDHDNLKGCMEDATPAEISVAILWCTIAI
jgi:hypothetical protein